MAAASTLSIAGKRPKKLPLAKIRLDGGTQSRTELDQDVIASYAEFMKSGRTFPPLLVVFDGKYYWLVDGFHRRWAAMKAKVKEFRCFIVKGAVEDARWLSYSANKDHGLHRSVEDKKRAVIAALKHPNGAKWSDPKIAEHVGVSPNMVKKYREQLESASQVAKVNTREGRDGKVYDTTNIGKRSEAEREPDYGDCDEEAVGNDIGEIEDVPAEETEKDCQAFIRFKSLWSSATQIERCLIRDYIEANWK